MYNRNIYHEELKKINIYEKNFDHQIYFFEGATVQCQAEINDLKEKPTRSYLNTITGLHAQKISHTVDSDDLIKLDLEIFRLKNLQNKQLKILQIRREGAKFALLLYTKICSFSYKRNNYVFKTWQNKQLELLCSCCKISLFKAQKLAEINRLQHEKKLNTFRRIMWWKELEKEQLYLKSLTYRNIFLSKFITMCESDYYMIGTNIKSIQTRNCSFLSANKTRAEILFVKMYEDLCLFNFSKEDTISDEWKKNEMKILSNYCQIQLDEVCKKINDIKISVIDAMLEEESKNLDSPKLKMQYFITTAKICENLSKTCISISVQEFELFCDACEENITNNDEKKFFLKIWKKIITSLNLIYINKKQQIKELKNLQIAAEWRAKKIRETIEMINALSLL